MTDALAAPEEKESSKARKFIIPILIGIVLILVVGLVASRSGLDKALLRQRIDAFAISLNKKGKAEGRDIQLTYKDIDILGSITNRHAVILEPQLSIKPLVADGKQANPSDSLIMRTAAVAIFPKAVDLTKLTVQMEKPIEFFDGADESRKLLTVTSDEGFKADIQQHAVNDRPYLAVTHTMPADIDLVYLREQQAEGKEEETPNIVPVYENLKLTQTPGGIIRSDMAQDGSGLGEAEVKLADLAIIPEVQPEGAIRIARIDSTWKHALNEKNHHVVDARLHIGDITAVPDVLPYAPMALSLDATYEGAAPQTAKDLASIREQESSIKLNKFAITAKDASLTATADFVASATDILPVGMATISLTNVPFILGELHRYRVLDKNDAMVGDILALVTGVPASELKDAAIDVSRVRGGSFTIGKTTFEEIFATVLKNSMTRRIETPAPGPTDAAPAEDKPARQNIQVEEGVRG